VKERHQALHGLLRILGRQYEAMAEGAYPDIEAMLGIVETLRLRAHQRAAQNFGLWSEPAQSADALAEHLSAVIDGCIMRRQALANECRDFAHAFGKALAGESTESRVTPLTDSSDQALTLFRSLRSQMRPARGTGSDSCNLCAG
jgi:hypothetical protein